MSSDFTDEMIEQLQAERDRGPFDFGRAIALLKAGRRVARKGWHGKGMHVELWRDVRSPYEGSVPVGPVLALHLPGNGGWRPGWNASTEDVLAEDWSVAP